MIGKIFKRKSPEAKAAAEAAKLEAKAAQTAETAAKNRTVFEMRLAIVKRDLASLEKHVGDSPSSIETRKLQQLRHQTKQGERYVRWLKEAPDSVASKGLARDAEWEAIRRGRSFAA